MVSAQYPPRTVVHLSIPFFPGENELDFFLEIYNYKYKFLYHIFVY